MNKRDADIESNKIVQVIAKLREQKGISRYKLAKGISMSKSTIIYIEEFKQVPKLSTIILICNFLEVKLDDVLKLARKENNQN